MADDVLETTTINGIACLLDERDRLAEEEVRLLANDSGGKLPQHIRAKVVRTRARIVALDRILGVWDD